jgi:uncharacterized membrane protein
MDIRKATFAAIKGMTIGALVGAAGLATLGSTGCAENNQKAGAGEHKCGGDKKCGGDQKCGGEKKCGTEKK